MACYGCFQQGIRKVMPSWSSVASTNNIMITKNRIMGGYTSQPPVLGFGVEKPNRSTLPTYRLLGTAYKPYYPYTARAVHPPQTLDFPLSKVCETMAAFCCWVSQVSFDCTCIQSSLCCRNDFGSVDWRVRPEDRADSLHSTVLTTVLTYLLL